MSSECLRQFVLQRGPVSGLFLCEFRARYGINHKFSINSAERTTYLYEKEHGKPQSSNPTAVYVKAITARPTTSNEGLSLNFAYTNHTQGISAGNSLGSTVLGVSRGNYSETRKSCVRPAIDQVLWFLLTIDSILWFLPTPTTDSVLWFLPTLTVDLVLWPAVDSILRLACTLIAHNAIFCCDDAPTSNHFFPVDVRFISQGSCPLARQEY